MRHTPDLLEAMKQSLRDLETLKPLNPDDLEIVDMRRTLKEQIAALERHLSKCASTRRTPTFRLARRFSLHPEDQNYQYDNC